MPNKKLKLILLSAVIILAIGLIVINNLRKKTGEIAQPGSLIPTPVILTEGSFNIAQEIKAEVTTDSTKEIEIVANSNQKSIVAYDLVITYEPNSLEVLSAESLLPDFKVYPLEKKEYFVLTGVKDIESKSPTVLTDTSIVKLKLLPKRNSTISVKIVESFGKEKSQMVDSESKILRPQVAEFKLEP